MSLETLLEAALFLEYQDKARQRGEVPKDYKSFAALQNSSPSPPPCNRGPCLPPPAPLAPPLPPPPQLSYGSSPKHHHHPAATPNHVYNHVNGHAAAVAAPPVSTPPPPPPPMPPSHYSSLAPHDGSYLAARLTAPPTAEPVKLGNHVPHQHLAGVAPAAQQQQQQHQQHYAASSSGETSPQDFKIRRLGAGTREVHNKLEKNRRAHLKECFDMLRRQLPSSHDDKKPSNLSVLHSAIRYIQSLKRKERDYEHEMERLAREKIACQQRLSSLKKELSAQWDNIDFAALLPEAPPPSSTPAAVITTPSGSLASAASRSAPRPHYDSDDDFEFEELEEEMRRAGRGTAMGDVSPNSASTSTASERGHPSDVEDLTMSSRPGSSRDYYSSPPPPAPSLPPTQQPPLPLEAARTSNISMKMESRHVEPSPIIKSEVKLEAHVKSEPLEDGRQLSDPLPPVARLQASQLQLHPQMLSAQGVTTLVGPTIQLLPSLRMVPTSAAMAQDQRHQGELRLHGSAGEINVVTTNMAMATVRPSHAAAVVSKPVNLSTSSTLTKLTASTAAHNHHLSNGNSVIRPPMTPGGGNPGTTVLTTVHGVGAHHLSTAAGITHVMAAGGATHLSTLTPLMAGPVMMTQGGPHPTAGVHILTTHTGKAPFQVVSAGPLLKTTHQVLSQAQYLSTTQLVGKPVMMVSSPQGMVMQRPPEPTGGPAGSGAAAGAH